MTKIHTVTLANGVAVLAKDAQDAADRWPLHYANRTQADRKAAELRAAGHDASIYRGIGRVFYVAVLPAKA
jgi:hypothetical protein